MSLDYVLPAFNPEISSAQCYNPCWIWRLPLQLLLPNVETALDLIWSAVTYQVTSGHLTPRYLSGAHAGVVPHLVGNVGHLIIFKHIGYHHIMVRGTPVHC